MMLSRDKQLLQAAITVKPKTSIQRRFALRRFANKRRKYPFPQVVYYLSIGTVPRSLWDQA